MFHFCFSKIVPFMR